MTPKRILLVEDDATLRDLCVEVLGSQTHVVVAVDDGAVALEEIQHRPPDVILLDLVMPRARLDGIALLSKLSAGPRIPIIILSALGDVLSELPSELTKALAITAILAKPFSLAALTREIDRLDWSGVPG
jgi:two-component system, NtrC family, response regulator AtoC